MHNVIHVSYTHINIEGGVVIDFAKWWTRSKITSLKVMNNITNPSFISTFVKKKEIAIIIPTL
jgi:hypothetical protein